MANYIQTTNKNNMPVLLNIDNIDMFVPSDNGAVVNVYFSDGESTVIVANFDDLTKAVQAVEV